MEKVLEPCDSLAVPLTPSLNAFMIDVSGLLFLMSLPILPLHLFPARPPNLVPRQVSSCYDFFPSTASVKIFHTVLTVTNTT